MKCPYVAYCLSYVLPLYREGMKFGLDFQLIWFFLSFNFMVWNGIQNPSLHCQSHSITHLYPQWAETCHAWATSVLHHQNGISLLLDLKLHISKRVWKTTSLSDWYPCICEVIHWGFQWVSWALGSSHLLTTLSNFKSSQNVQNWRYEVFTQRQLKEQP